MMIQTTKDYVIEGMPLHKGAYIDVITSESLTEMARPLNIIKQNIRAYEGCDIPLRSTKNKTISTDHTVKDIIDMYCHTDHDGYNNGEIDSGSHNDTRNLYRMPHLRRGHFRHLVADRFTKKRGKTVYVRPSFVKGKAYTIDDSGTSNADHTDDMTNDNDTKGSVLQNRVS